jgi:AAHS family 4-hydroxybenzoate transporter-like MFS transporter
MVMVKQKLRYLLFSNYLNLFAFSVFSPLYALYATGIGATPQNVGFSYSVNTLASACAIFLFGRIEDRMKDKRPMVVIGYFWLSAGAFAFLLVHSVPQLFMVQIFNAIGTGILLPSWKATYSKALGRGKEAREWSFYDGGNMLATAGGAALSGIVLARYGFHAIFILIGGIQLIAAMLSVRLNIGKLR